MYLKAIIVLAGVLTSRMLSAEVLNAKETVLLKSPVKFKQTSSEKTAIEASLEIPKHIRISDANQAIKGRLRMIANHSTIIFVKHNLILDDIIIDKRFDLVNPHILGPLAAWPFQPDGFLRFAAGTRSSPGADAAVYLNLSGALIENLTLITRSAGIKAREVTGVGTCVLEIFSIDDKQWGTAVFSFPLTIDLGRK